MKKIILIAISFILISGFNQDPNRKGQKKVKKEKDESYYDATNEYYSHNYDSSIYKLSVLDFVYDDNSNIQYYLGMSYFFQAKYDTALAYFRHAIETEEPLYSFDYQNGEYSPHIIYFYMGFSYEKEGEIEKAIVAYREYIKLEKDEDIIYNTEKRIQTLKEIHNIK